MRAVIQRVSKASVTVGDELISSIGRGICVLVGIGREDGDEDVEYMVRKLIGIRIFEGDEGRRWDRSVKDLGLEILCVSQFTLHGRLKGNKLDFSHSMAPAAAPEFYANFLEKLRHAYVAEKDGRFGAMMNVELVNDGPVTIVVDSRDRNN